MPGIKGTDRRSRLPNFTMLTSGEVFASICRAPNEAIFAARQAQDMTSAMFWFERDAEWPYLDWGYRAYDGEHYVTPVAGFDPMLGMPYCGYVVTPVRVVTREQDTYPTDTRRVSDWSVVSPQVRWPF